MCHSYYLVRTFFTPLPYNYRRRDRPRDVSVDLSPRAWVRLERRTALAPMVCAAPRAAAADASEVARRANAHRSARRLDRCQWARPRVRGIM